MAQTNRGLEAHTYTHTASLNRILSQPLRGSTNYYQKTSNSVNNIDTIVFNVLILPGYI